MKENGETQQVVEKEKITVEEVVNLEGETISGLLVSWCGIKEWSY